MPDWTARLEELIKRWTRILALIGLLGLVLQSLVTVADVLLRALFDAPIYGLSDMYELVVLFMVAASFPASLAGRHQITIRFLGKVTPWRMREALELFGHVLTLCVFVAMGSQLVIHTISLFKTGQTTWLLGIPMGPSWAIATTLILLCTPVQAVVTAIQIARLFAPRAPTDRDPGGLHSGTEAVTEFDEYTRGAV